MNNTSERLSLDSEHTLETQVTPLDQSSFTPASACSGNSGAVQKGVSLVVEGKVLVLLSCSQLDQHLAV